MLGEQPLCCGFGVKNLIKSKQFSLDHKLINLLNNSDLVFGNLEAPISNPVGNKSYLKNVFLADPEVINLLNSMHFRVLSIANNHIMEHGKDVFYSTVELLKAENIECIGLLGSIKVLQIKDLKICFLAYSFIEDFVQDSPYNKIKSESIIFADIQRIKSKVDLIIVSLHWGSEYVPYPSPKQVEIGRKIIDCGGDILIGHHAHVIQGYEIYKEKLIIYGLGNFIFDDTYIKRTQKSFIANIEVDIHTKDLNIEIIPLFNKNGSYFPSVIDEDKKLTILKELLFIKDMLAKNSLYEYNLFIGDYSSLEAQYKKELTKEASFHFIKNIYRYPVSFSMSTIGNVINKHLWSNKHEAFSCDK
jgi:gamma-polyglutamate biosynthesis protein CapA